MVQWVSYLHQSVLYGDCKNIMEMAFPLLLKHFRLHRNIECVIYLVRILSQVMCHCEEKPCRYLKHLLQWRKWEKKKTTRLYSHCHRSSWKKKSILLRLNNPSSQVFFVLVKSINKCIFLYSVNVFTNWSRFLTHVKPICQHISQTVFAVVYSAMMEQVWICVGPAFSDTEAQSITKHIDQFLCKTCIMYY